MRYVRYVLCRILWVKKNLGVSNCMHTFGRKYLPLTFENVNASHSAVRFPVSNRSRNVKINSRAIFQWKRFHANGPANNIRHPENISWGINAVSDSSNVASFRLRLYASIHPRACTRALYTHIHTRGRASIRSVKPINYRAWTTTLFCASGIYSCGIGAGNWTMEYERNQFAIC